MSNSNRTSASVTGNGASQRAGNSQRTWEAQGNATDRGRAPAGFGNSNRPANEPTQTARADANRPPWARGNSQSGAVNGPASRPSAPNYSSNRPSSSNSGRSYEPPQRSGETRRITVTAALRSRVLTIRRPRPRTRRHELIPHRAAAIRRLHVPTPRPVAEGGYSGGGGSRGGGGSPHSSSGGSSGGGGSRGSSGGGSPHSSGGGGSSHGGGGSSSHGRH